MQTTTGCVHKIRLGPVKATAPTVVRVGGMTHTMTPDKQAMNELFVGRLGRGQK